MSNSLRFYQCASCSPQIGGGQPNRGGAGASSQQSGGASSYRHGSVGSIGPQGDPAWLTRYGLQYLDQTPMFKPLQMGTHLATPSSGLVPEGIYYMNKAQLDCMCQKNHIKLYKKNKRGDMTPYTQNELIDKLRAKGGKNAY